MSKSSGDKENYMLTEKVIEVIIGVYDTKNETIPLRDLVSLVAKRGKYTRKKARRYVLRAMWNDILYVDAIERLDTVMMALTDFGEELWDDSDTGYY